MSMRLMGLLAVLAVVVGLSGYLMHQKHQNDIAVASKSNVIYGDEKGF